MTRTTKLGRTRSVLAATALVGTALLSTTGVANARPAPDPPGGGAGGKGSVITARNLYVSETGCELAGGWGAWLGQWTFWWCEPRSVPDDDRPWYQLWTVGR